MKAKAILFMALLFLMVPVSMLNVTKAGTTWSIETVDSTGSVGWYSSLALDSSNNPHISYYDVTNGYLKYALWTGSSWSIQTVDSTGDVGLSTSLALDSTGNPHISYYDYTNRDLKYVRWTGSAWTTPQTVDSTGDVGVHCSLALDSSNNPHISYYDVANGYLKYALWTGSSWSIQTVDSTNAGSDNSLALDSADNPHISYHDYGPNYDLKYVRWTGSSWSIQTVDSTGNVGRWTSLALDSSGNPHISYYDDTNGDLKYTKWTGSTWSTQTVDSTGSVGWFTSLALDSSGNPHISYYDDTNGDLKYAKGQRLAPTGSIVINSGDAYTTSRGVTLTLTYSATAATVTDIRLSNDGVWDTETWETPTTSKGWTLTSGDEAKTVYYQIRDDEGAVSTMYSDTIFLDMTWPTGSIVINGGNASTTSTAVTLTLTYSDSGSGVSEVRYSNDGVWDTEAWESPSTIKSWNLTSGEGTKTVRYQVKDNAGLYGLTYSDTIELVADAPAFEELSFIVTFEETDYVVGTCSNSSVSGLTFNQGLKRLQFSVDGSSGTVGLCNVTVPAELMSGGFTIYMDDTPLVGMVDYTETFNGTHSLFSINYAHSSHIIEIFSTDAIPEFTVWLLLPFLMAATSLAIALRKKLKKLPIIK